MTPTFIFFLVLALVAVGAALGMLLTRNAVYAALFLIINFSTIAVFYLMLDAPFIAMSQITVYAGAIMVLFLFVIMLLGGEQLRRAHVTPWQPPLAVLLGGVLLVEFGYVLISRGAGLPNMPALQQGFGDPTQIGSQLFSTFLLPFEVTSVLLLVAMVGAIVLTMGERKK